MREIIWVRLLLYLGLFSTSLGTSFGGMLYFPSIYAIVGDYCIISYVSFNSYDFISRIYAGGSYHPCLSKVNAL